MENCVHTKSGFVVMKNILKNITAFLFLTFCILPFVEPLEAQVLSEKSTEITVKNGEKFYVHTVKRKETLSSIVELYGVSEIDVLLNNSNIKRGKVKTGQKLLIPFIQNELENDIVQDEMIDPGFLIEKDCDMVFVSPDSIYRVALMLPLFLEQVDSVLLKSPANVKLLTAKPFSFIHFYEGFMIAVDSLVNTRNLKLELKVYDIDNNITKVDVAMQDPWLKNADLIIGPFYIKPFEMMMGFADTNGIMIVNPLTNRSNLVDNQPNLVKVKPSYYSQIDYVRNLVKDRYVDNNVFIVRMDDNGDSTIIADLSRELKEVINPYTLVSNRKIVSCLRMIYNKMEDKDEVNIEDVEFHSDGTLLDYTLANVLIDDSVRFNNDVYVVNYNNDRLETVNKYGSVARNNVVIVYTDQSVAATQLINKVNMLTERYPVTLICMPEWSKFDKLFSENLMNMSSVYLDDKFLDYNSVAVNSFICKFRKIYGTEPTDYAYQGFDIAWYFLNALMRFGPDMSSCLPYYQIPLLNNDFVFVRNEDGDGLENINWNMYQFKNYEKVKIETFNIIDMK